jgi:hypothetical protein
MLRVAGRAADIATLAALTPSAYEVEITLPGQRSRGILRPLLASRARRRHVCSRCCIAGLYFAGCAHPAPGT